MDRKTDRRTSRLYDWIGPVGPIQWKPPNGRLCSKERSWRGLDICGNSFSWNSLKKYIFIKITVELSPLRYIFIFVLNKAWQITLTLFLYRGVWNIFYNVELINDADELQVCFKYMNLLKFHEKTQIPVYDCFHRFVHYFGSNLFSTRAESIPLFYF